MPCSIRAPSPTHRRDDMTDARVGERERERERLGGEWFGAPQEGQVPVRADGAGGAAAKGAGDVPAGRRWLRRMARVLRDAAIGVCLMAMVPIGLTTLAFAFNLSAGTYFPSPSFGEVRARLMQAEPLRAFAIAKDPSITPEQAGAAMAALQPEGKSGFSTFGLRPVAHRPARSWDNIKVTADMFVSSRPQFWEGPTSTHILQAVPAGLSPQELDFLRTVATAPVWREFDLVARAPAMDIIGARFVVPFGDHATYSQLPLLHFAGSKELAYAGVSRAAYYLAVGQRAEAEAALKSVIGFGFALIDNATSAIDAVIGRVIVGIGQDGLEQFYRVTHDPRWESVVATEVPSKSPRSIGKAWSSNRPSRQENHDRLVEIATSRTEPRGMRYESLFMLSQSSCSNPVELVFGTGRQVRDAFEVAGRDLARYPSERALLDLALHTTDRFRATTMKRSLPEQVVVGAATVAGIVFRNPRMAFCTRLITGGGNPD